MSQSMEAPEGDLTPLLRRVENAAARIGVIADSKAAYLNYRSSVLGGGELRDTEADALAQFADAIADTVRALVERRAAAQ